MSHSHGPSRNLGEDRGLCAHHLSKFPCGGSTPSSGTVSNLPQDWVVCPEPLLNHRFWRIRCAPSSVKCQTCSGAGDVHRLERFPNTHQTSQRETTGSDCERYCGSLVGRYLHNDGHGLAESDWRTNRPPSYPKSGSAWRPKQRNCALRHRL